MASVGFMASVSVRGTPALALGSLTHSLSRSLTHSLTHSLTQSVTHSVGHSLSRSVTHSVGHSVGRWLTHSLTQSVGRSDPIKERTKDKKQNGGWDVENRTKCLSAKPSNWTICFLY